MFFFLIFFYIYLKGRDIYIYIYIQPIKKSSIEMYLNFEIKL
jgi:hypothetical protein